MSEVFFEGPCPFLTCHKTEAHSHPVCDTCGAVRYGNLQCPTCQSHAPERRRELDETMATLKAAAEMDAKR